MQQVIFITDAGTEISARGINRNEVFDALQAAAHTIDAIESVDRDDFAASLPGFVSPLPGGGSMTTRFRPLEAGQAYEGTAPETQGETEAAGADTEATELPAEENLPQGQDTRSVFADLTPTEVFGIFYCAKCRGFHDVRAVIAANLAEIRQ